MLDKELEKLKPWQWYRRRHAKKAFIEQLEQRLSELPEYLSTLEKHFSDAELSDIIAKHYAPFTNPKMQSQLSVNISVLPKVLRALITVSVSQPVENIPSQILYDGIAVAKQKPEAKKKSGIFGKFMFRFFLKRKQKKENKHFLRLSYMRLKEELIDVKQNLPRLFLVLRKLDKDIPKEKNFLFKRAREKQSLAGMQRVIETGFEFDEIAVLEGAAPDIARFLLERLLGKPDCDRLELLKTLIKNGDRENVMFLMGEIKPELEQWKAIVGFAAGFPNAPVFEYVLNYFPIENLPVDINLSEKVVTGLVSRRLIQALIKENTALLPLFPLFNRFTVKSIEEVLAVRVYNLFSRIRVMKKLKSFSGINTAVQNTQKTCLRLFDEYAKKGDLKSIEALLSTGVVFDEVAALRGATSNVARFLLARLLLKSDCDRVALLKILIKNGDLENVQFLMGEIKPDLELRKALIVDAAGGSNIAVFEFLLGDIPVEQLPATIPLSTRKVADIVFARVTHALGADSIISALLPLFNRFTVQTIEECLQRDDYALFSRIRSVSSVGEFSNIKQAVENTLKSKAKQFLDKCSSKATAGEMRALLNKMGLAQDEMRVICEASSKAARILMSQLLSESNAAEFLCIMIEKKDWDNVDYLIKERNVAVGVAHVNAISVAGNLNGLKWFLGMFPVGSLPVDIIVPEDAGLRQAVIDIVKQELTAKKDGDISGLLSLLNKFPLKDMRTIIISNDYSLFRCVSSVVHLKDFPNICAAVEAVTTKAVEDFDWYAKNGNRHNGYYLTEIKEMLDKGLPLDEWRGLRGTSTAARFFSERLFTEATGPELLRVMIEARHWDNVRFLANEKDVNVGAVHINAAIGVNYIEAIGPLLCAIPVGSLPIDLVISEKSELRAPIFERVKQELIAKKDGDISGLFPLLNKFPVHEIKTMLASENYVLFRCVSVVKNLMDFPNICAGVEAVRAKAVKYFDWYTKNGNRYNGYYLTEIKAMLDEGLPLDEWRGLRGTSKAARFFIERLFTEATGPELLRVMIEARHWDNVLFLANEKDVSVGAVHINAAIGVNYIEAIGPLLCAIPVGSLPIDLVISEKSQLRAPIFERLKQELMAQKDGDISGLFPLLNKFPTQEIKKMLSSENYALFGCVESLEKRKDFPNILTAIEKIQTERNQQFHQYLHRNYIPYNQRYVQELLEKGLPHEKIFEELLRNVPLEKIPHNVDISAYPVLFLKKALRDADCSFDGYDNNGKEIWLENTQPLLAQCLSEFNKREHLDFSWIYEKMDPDKNETWKDRMQPFILAHSVFSSYRHIHQRLHDMQEERAKSLPKKTKPKKAVIFADTRLLHTTPTFYQKPSDSRRYPTQVSPKKGFSYSK